jgi:hypothetical protein
VIYVGAPLHFDFGDSGDRFCWYFDEDPSKPPRPFKLNAPKFVTTRYPRVGVPPTHGGFLRVLDTPGDVFEDVKKQARDRGWLDCVAIEASMPTEAIRVLSSAIIADETAIRSWVDEQYPDLPDVRRGEISDFGIDCLREAQR